MVRRRASLHGPPFCKRKNTIIRETGKENGGISYAYGVIIVQVLEVSISAVLRSDFCHSEINLSLWNETA